MSRIGFGAVTALAVTMGMLAYQPAARAAELTEGQARMVFMDNGCANVGGLSRDSNGMWHGTCQKTPVPAAMAIDQNGKVVPAPAYQGVSASAARSILTDAGCGNMSSLTQDASGIWHATCQATPVPKAMIVGADGKAGPDTGTGALTGSHARSILMDAGCSTISGLEINGTGAWSGMCWKGGAPVVATVTPDGKASFR